MPSQTVSVQMTGLFEQLSTVLTSIWPVVCMRSDVGISLFESLTTNPILELPFFLTVDDHVP